MMKYWSNVCIREHCITISSLNFLSIAVDQLRIVLQTAAKEEEKYINAVFVNVRTQFHQCCIFNWGLLKY